MMRYFVFVLFVVVCCCLLLLPIQLVGATTPSNWNMFGYSSWHKRVNPNEHTLNKKNVFRLSHYWTVHTGGTIESRDTIVSGGVAYFTSYDGKLYAVNASTGTSIWSKTLEGHFVTSSPAVFNEVIYVEAGKNTAPYTTLYALNAKTGKILWSRDGVGPYSSPTIVHGIVYAGGSFNKFYALNAITGTVLWSHKFSTIPNYVPDSPAVVNGVVYVAINKETTASMYALNASTGKILWTTRLSSMVSQLSTSVADGLVFTGVGDGLLYALNASNGRVNWTSQNLGNVISSPAIFNKMVYIGGNGTNNHKVFALNERSGKLVWTANTNSNVIASATVANGVVYDASMDGRVYAFDAVNGTTLWSRTSDSNFSSPVISDGIVYISSGYDLYTFHLHI